MPDERDPVGTIAAPGLAPLTVMMRLRTVALLLNLPLGELRERIARGEWPLPVVEDGESYYPAAWVSCWSRTGRWPAEVRFKGEAPE